MHRVDSIFNRILIHCLHLNGDQIFIENLIERLNDCDPVQGGVRFIYEDPRDLINRHSSLFTTYDTVELLLIIKPSQLTLRVWTTIWNTENRLNCDSTCRHKEVALMRQSSSFTNCRILNWTLESCMSCS